MNWHRKNKIKKYLHINVYTKDKEEFIARCVSLFWLTLNDFVFVLIFYILFVSLFTFASQLQYNRQSTTADVVSLIYHQLFE